MNKWELVIIWTDGDKTIETCNSEEEARRGEANYKMAFGNQIQFSCVRKQIA